MLKTLALAGATAALVIGTMAVAQTTPNSDPNYNNRSAAAPPAGQTTTTTTTTDQNNANNTATSNMAGERG